MLDMLVTTRLAVCRAADSPEDPIPDEMPDEALGPVSRAGSCTDLVSAGGVLYL
jgi:hypothetical protein